MQYFPIGLPFLVAIWFLFALLVALIQIGILEYAFESMGVSRRYMFSLLVLCLLGSYINIPVAQLPAHHVRSGEVVDFFGIQYVVPVVVNAPGTIVAVNLGGAVIPCLLSLYLIFKHGLYFRALVAVAIVTVVVHLMAHPVEGVGIDGHPDDDLAAGSLRRGVGCRGRLRRRGRRRRWCHRLARRQEEAGHYQDR